MNFLRIAAISAALAIALGAFGAHALEERLTAADKLEVWRTATLYHIAHSLALMALALAKGPILSKRFALAAKLWGVGILLFSGSLYALALEAPRWLGPVTPVGGLSLIAGWMALALVRGDD
ncbi:MAG: hypothetical protein CBD18_04810 [Opitutales bacterium TMED158]|nr:MAG: hypothetical protein CBD18_04810 [Opitutales bacterium TMED158]